MVLTKKELISFVKEQRRIFDIVRLVDVSLNIQYNISDDGNLKQEPYQCYAVWNKNKRCENCISAKAFAMKDKLSKFEFVNKDVYFVLALYTEIDNTAYVIELVSKLNDEVLFSAYGKDDFVQSIESYNRKLYMDSLTNAYNRNYFNEQLIKSNRFNGIVMFDVDNFKNINDTYGHAIGDFVLKEIIKIVDTFIRSTDAVIRLGGDEFLVVFQKISKNAFTKRLEKIRQTVSTIHFIENSELRVSISMGAVYSNDSTIDLIEVDKNLYEAKKQKNSIVIKEI